MPPPAGAVTLEMDLQNLLMEGARRIDERGRLAEVFPDLGMAVETVANPERVKHSVNLTPEEWKVFFLVDGRRTLSEICQLAGNVDEAVTLQILHNLVLAKFVAVVPAPVSTPTATLPPPAAEAAHGTQKMGDDRGTPAGGVSGTASPWSSPKGRRRSPRTTPRRSSPPRPSSTRRPASSRASRLVLVKDGGETALSRSRATPTPLGRHRNNDIVVSDPKVSSFHARFDRTLEGFVLVDLRSRNGSFVNGKRVDAVRPPERATRCGWGRPGCATRWTDAPCPRSAPSAEIRYQVPSARRSARRPGPALRRHPARRTSASSTSATPATSCA